MIDRLKARQLVTLVIRYRALRVRYVDVDSAQEALTLLMVTPAYRERLLYCYAIV